MVMDRNLLLAVYALRAGLIDGDQMAQYYAAWAGDKTRSMSERLLESGSVDEAGLRRIQRLVDEYLGSRDDDAPAPSVASTDEGVSTPTISDPVGRAGDFASSGGPEPGQGDTIVLEPA